MKYTISSGHGKYVSGASCYINEVEEARKVVDKVSEILKELNESPNIYHDNTSKDKTTNVNTIVKYHNSTNRDKDISIHFNACNKTDNPVGVEVLYYTDGNKELASNISKAISNASGLKNRGAKQRTNLGFLKNTNKGAVLIEVCFVDSKKDVELYKDNFEKICIAIAETLSGKKYTSNNTSNNTSNDKTKYYRVIAGSYTNKQNAEAMKEQLTKYGIPSFLEVFEK